MDASGNGARAIEQFAQILSAWGAGSQGELRTLIGEEVAAAGEPAFQVLIQRVLAGDAAWGFHASEPLVRAISRRVIERMLEPGSVLEAGSGLEDARRHPSVFLGNHLSYVDVNVLDCMLARAGHSDVANRVTAIVGPKVYSLPIRRLAALAFGVIKIPQSSALASEEAVMAPREVAKIAGEMLHVARGRVAEGDHLLVFPEGSRSRTHALRPLLPAASRYFEQVDGVIVPFAHWGTEKFVPLGEDHVYPACVQARIGRGLPIRELFARCGRRRALLCDVVGFAIADLLPPAYRGVYADVEPGREKARTIADELAAA